MLKCETIKLLEDNAGENIGDLGFDNEFLDKTPEAWFMTGKINILDLKGKTSDLWKTLWKRMERQATNWDKLFVKHISYKGLVSKTYKELLKFNTKKTNNGQDI